jgi:hypothetical protein
MLILHRILLNLPGLSLRQEYHHAPNETNSHKMLGQREKKRKTYSRLVFISEMKGRGYRHTPQRYSLRIRNEGRRSKTANNRGPRRKKKSSQSRSSDNPPSGMRRDFRVCVRFDFRWLAHHSCIDAAALSSVVGEVGPRAKQKLESSFSNGFNQKSI